jgi:hypothetical protein
MAVDILNQPVGELEHSSQFETLVSRTTDVSLILPRREGNLAKASESLGGRWASTARSSNLEIILTRLNGADRFVFAVRRGEVIGRASLDGDWSNILLDPAEESKLMHSVQFGPFKVYFAVKNESDLRRFLKSCGSKVFRNRWDSKVEGYLIGHRGKKAVREPNMDFFRAEDEDLGLPLFCFNTSTQTYESCSNFIEYFANEFTILGLKRPRSRWRKHFGISGGDSRHSPVSVFQFMLETAEAPTANTDLWELLGFPLL